jgi:restriction system protein
VLSGPIRRGQREAAGERERRAGIAEADRHRQLASLDAMTGTDFERHVANLCLRDGLEIVQSGGGAGDLGADVIANLPDCRRVVIQCKRYKASGSVTGPEMQQFLGTVRAEHGADVALFVTTARRFTQQATDLAGRHQVYLIQRDRLAFWNNGTPLPSLLSSWERNRANGGEH